MRFGKKTSWTGKTLTIITTFALVFSLCLPSFPTATAAYAADGDSQATNVADTGQNEKTDVQAEGDEVENADTNVSALPNDSDKTNSELIEGAGNLEGDAPTNEVDSEIDTDPGTASTAKLNASPAAETKAASDTPTTRDATDPISPTVIENVAMKLLPTGDQTVNADDLIQTKGTVSAQFEYAISGSTNHAPRTIEIKIPYQVFDARDGYTKAEVNSFNLPSIPKAPTVGDGPYNYTIDEENGYIVITNCKTIDAAYRFEATIDFIPTPIGIVDMTITDPINATVTITDEGQDPVEETSNALKAQLNTYAMIDNSEKVSNTFDKTRTRNCLYEEWNDAWGEEPADADDYIYVEWAAGVSAEANQPFTYTFSDNPAQGELVGYTTAVKEYSGYGNRWYYDSELREISKNDAGELTWEIAAKAVDTYNSYRIGIVVRYPKSELLDGESHTLENSITISVTPADGQDPASEQTRTATYVYRPMKFTVPRGESSFEKGQTYSTTSGGLTFLESGKPVDVYEFRLTGSATGYQYTLSDGADPTKPDSYGYKPYTLELTDDYVFMNDFSDEKLRAGDYEFTRVNINESIYDYVPNTSSRKYELKEVQDKCPLDLYGEYEGSWQKLGTYTYDSDTRKWSFASSYAGVEATSETVVSLPSGCTGVRLTAETAKARVWVRATLNMRILPSEHIEELLETAPRVKDNWGSDAVRIDNVGSFRALDSERNNFSGEGWHSYSSSDAVPEIYRPLITQLDNAKYGQTIVHEWAHRDLTELTISGKTSKKNMYRYVEFFDEPENKRLRIPYQIDTYERCYYSGTDVEPAYLFESGVLEPEETGTFYDLLPVDVIPDPESVSVFLYSDSNSGTKTPYDDEGEEGSMLAGVETIPNWNGTGRVMLVIHVQNPEHVFSAYGSGITKGANTGFSVRFSAYYSYESLLAYGNPVGGGRYSAQFRNIVAYMSDNESITDGYPDDPAGHDYEAYFDVLRDANSDGISGDGAPTNVRYASYTTTVTGAPDVEAALTKRVRGGDALSWVDGVLDDPKVNLEASETYQYRLSYTTGSGTAARDNIIFDSLENYTPEEESDDYGSAQWRGELVSIDTSQMEARGVGPVIYYSTIEGLDIEANHDLSVESVWNSTKPDDLSSVTAIAIDCRHTPEGEDYIMGEKSVIMATVTMKVTDEESEVGAYTAKDAYAFNQAYHLGTLMSTSYVVTEPDKLIHNEYTKVGLIQPLTDVSVDKNWDISEDEEIPDSITVHLLANDEPVLDDEGSDITIDLTSNDDWSHVFEDLVKYDENGERIQYTVEEDVPDGYQYEVEGTMDEGFTITNSPMEPVVASLSAVKQMTGRDFKDGDSFTFKIEPQDDAPMPDGVDDNGTLTITPTEGAEAEISFGSATLEAVGTYSYTITEVAGDDVDIDYSDSSVTATIEVERGANGKLSATVTYDDSEDPAIFENVYYEPVTLPIAVTKALEGRELSAGEFEFELLDEGGNVIQTAKNGFDLDGDGAVSGDDEVAAVRFTQEFGLADAGKTFSYTIREVAGSDENMEYDTHVASYAVTVSDNGDGTLSCTVKNGDEPTVFTNNITVTEEETEEKEDPPVSGKPDKIIPPQSGVSPRTGDSIPIVPIAVVAIVALAAMGISLRLRKS